MSRVGWSRVCAAVEPQTFRAGRPTSGGRGRYIVRLGVGASDGASDFREQLECGTSPHRGALWVMEFFPRVEFARETFVVSRAVEEISFILFVDLLFILFVFSTK